MKPHFFGDKAAPLYGVYDEPRGSSDNKLAVLACYPIAGEYMRAHRAFRQLTNLLSRSGAHVMRFDYFGTGDSAGFADDGGIARWCADIGTAVEELQELSGAEKVKLVGLRVGATMAFLAAADQTPVDHVVLWDPVVDGAGGVRQMMEAHIEEQEERGNSTKPGEVIGVHGFGVSRALRDELNGIDLRVWTPPPSLRTDVVVSEERPEWQELHDRLEALPNEHRFVLSPSLGNWHEADEFGSALIPQQIIQSVIACLTGSCG
jgi:uncharacterized protein